MPNTNPSDLDRDDWVASVFVSNHGVDMALEAHIACKLPDGVHKLYAHPALPRASGVPEAEAVAWTSEGQLSNVEKGFTGTIRSAKDEFMNIALFASPPPVAATSGEAEAVAYATQEDLDNIKNGTAVAAGLLWPDAMKEPCGDYVVPLYLAAPPSPIASEPKDAGVDPIPNPIETYEKTGELVRLLVEYDPDDDDSNPLEDTATTAWTIGFNLKEHTDEDVWEIAGWSWKQDVFTKSSGKPIGWLPFHSSAERGFKDAGSGEGHETDGAFLARIGTDGAKWAAEFIKIADKLGHKGIDEGWMIGWFANAIEAGRSAGRAERKTL